MKISANCNCNVKKWSQRLNTFQDYLPRCLWITGAKRGEWPEAYEEIRKKKILQFTLPPAYQKRLNSDRWCLSEETYKRSIGKIAEVEPDILLKIKQLKTTRDNVEVILELQEKVELCTKTGNGKGKHRNKDKDKTTQKINGQKDENDYYLCGNCGKTHKSVYRKPVAGTTSNQGGSDAPRKWMCKSATKNYIKQMVTSETKNKKRKGKRRYSSRNSDSSSSEENHGEEV